MSSGFTGYLLSDGVTDLSSVFMNINAGALLANENVFKQKNTFSGGIDLSGSFLYGRSDGYLFDTSFNSMFPVGYTAFVSNPVTNGTSGTNYPLSITIYPGKWIINYGVEGKASSSYTASSKISFDLSANANIIYRHSNTRPAYVFPITSSPSTTLILKPLAIITTARVLSQTTLESNLRLTGSGTITLNSTLTITKIA